jgi:hypothetical protein
MITEEPCYDIYVIEGKEMYIAFAAIIDHDYKRHPIILS